MSGMGVHTVGNVGDKGLKRCILLCKHTVFKLQERRVGDPGDNWGLDQCNYRNIKRIILIFCKILVARRDFSAYVVPALGRRLGMRLILWEFPL